MVVDKIKHILDSDAGLRTLVEQSIARAAVANPHRDTNPVRTLDGWFAYLERFLRLMPWQSLELGENKSFFRRIDQCIGYFYFLLDQPLPELRDKHYWYPSVQYEPAIAQWLVEYNRAWGRFLDSPASWSGDYYRLACSDRRFELLTGRYETPDNWHSWNDFFMRRLNTRPSVLNSPFLSPCDGVLASMPVKTASPETLTDLLGDCPYKARFEGGKAVHWVLDVFDYHRFHAPCNGMVLDRRVIQGIHAGGGVIIWDEQQGRYRYDQLGATGFQSLETRGIIVLDTPAYGLLALVAVGVQQVSSVRWSDKQLSLSCGDEIGSFAFGGSDIVLFFEPGRAPSLPENHACKALEPLL